MKIPFNCHATAKGFAHKHRNRDTASGRARGKGGRHRRPQLKAWHRTKARACQPASLHGLPALPRSALPCQFAVDPAERSPATAKWDLVQIAKCNLFLRKSTLAH